MNSFLFLVSADQYLQNMRIYYLVIFIFAAPHFLLDFEKPIKETSRTLS